MSWDPPPLPRRYPHLLSEDRNRYCVPFVVFRYYWEVTHLIIIPREVDEEDDQKTDGVTVYKQILKMQN
jgi:hypothetical protein